LYVVQVHVQSTHLDGAALFSEHGSSWYLKQLTLLKSTISHKKSMV